MKRKTLTTAVLAGIGGVAGIANISGAVNLNPDGLGQVLIYPFYTVNGGNDTLVSVVNTTDEVKAVKVRFLESKNSREVRDFNLYLSPFDVWVGAVTSTGDTDNDPALLIQPRFTELGDQYVETSCTAPIIPDAGIAFTNSLLTERAPNGVLVDNTLARTREGYIEIIEMGVVDEDVDAAVTGYEGDAIHTPAGTEPFDCDSINDAWRPVTSCATVTPGGIGTWFCTPGLDVRAPTGGLFGGASIFNVNQGYRVSYSADAIDGFFTPADGTVDLHRQPGDTLPSLTQAFNSGSAGDATSFVFSNDPNNPSVIASDWIDGIDAVSAIFMRSSVMGEYAIETVTGGATEWVLTFPTKRFYVEPQGANDTATLDPAIRPFTSQFGANGFGACEAAALEIYDRDEDFPAAPLGDIQFSPAPPPDQPDIPLVCFEAQVVTFGQGDAGIFGTVPSDILGSPNSVNFPADVFGFENGWARINFDPATVGTVFPGFGQAHTMTSLDGDTYDGLPVTGFSMEVVRNSTLTDPDTGENVLSNYAGLFQIHSDRMIIGS